MAGRGRAARGWSRAVLAGAGALGLVAGLAVPAAAQSTTEPPPSTEPPTTVDKPATTKAPTPTTRPRSTTTRPRSTTTTRPRSTTTAARKPATTTTTTAAPTTTTTVEATTTTRRGVVPITPPNTRPTVKGTETLERRIDDPESSRAVNRIIAALLALAGGLLFVVLIYWRVTRPVEPVLERLELIGSRRFRRADAVRRARLLDRVPRALDPGGEAASAVP